MGIKRWKRSCFYCYFSYRVTLGKEVSCTFPFVNISIHHKNYHTATVSKLDDKLRDELALLNNEIDVMELEKSYEDEDIVNPDVRLEIPPIADEVGKKWEFHGHTEITKKPDHSSENPDQRIADLDLPHFRGGSDQEWSYRRIRDLIATLNVGLFEYADRLSAYIAYSLAFKEKYIKCGKYLAGLELELKNIIQDKVKLQEMLNDLTAKFNMLQHALKKAEDINQDNKESIEKIRVNRDKCMQTAENRNEVIASLRNQNTELRRHLSSLRSKLG